MKKFQGIRKVLDGINQLNGLPSQANGGVESDVNDNLQGENFTLAKVGRYGFPYQAISLAIDPVQKLIAIGTTTGSIRICGKPGVEFHVNHESNAAVTLLHFLINQGGLVSVCDNCSLHIWSIRQKQPALIQSLNFKKEKITAIHAPCGSKWLYVGTERGNTYIVNVETFKVSGYVILWNHVIDVSCKSSPGPVTSIISNPVDQNKLLINYDSGVCVIWDLRAKKLQSTYNVENPSSYITVGSWHMDGRQFMTGHYDGGLSTWNIKNAKKPEDRQLPHGTRNRNSKEGSGCCPVTKLEWHTGESSMIIFSGGMPYGNKNKGLTVMRGRSKSLLLSDYVIDFQCLVLPAGPQELPQPQALFVLLKNEIVVFDLCGSIGPNMPWFSIPYTFSIHESPVTCVQFYSECPSELLAALHGLKTTHHHEPSNQSRRPWPITGGSEGEINQDPAIIITGHADGTIRFWDATSNMLISCSKIPISRLFEKIVSRQSSTTSNLSKASSLDVFDDPFAVQNICLCPYGRIMTIVCQSHFLVVFKFSLTENVIETTKLEVSFIIEQAQEANESPTSLTDPNNSFNEGLRKSSSSHRLSSTSITSFQHPPLRSTGQKWPVGFQPFLVCLQIASEPAPNITSVAVSSLYGLVCFGNQVGLAVVDYQRNCLVTVIMSYELGVPGEWTDPSLPEIKTPLRSTKSNPVSPISEDRFTLLNGGTELRRDKRKDRGSRMLGVNNDTHRLLKRPSFRLSNIKERDKDKDNKDKDKEKDVGLDTEDSLNIFRDKKDEPTGGFINALTFGHTYTRKGGNQVCPSLWVGTSTGDVTALAFSVPTSGLQRIEQAVMVLNTGTHLTFNSCIIDITSLDKSGNICGSPFEYWRDRHGSYSDLNRANVQTMHTESNSRQFLSVATEKKIIVKNLPNFKNYAHAEPVESNGFVVKAEPMTVEGGNCIGCLTTEGYLKIYSFPTLRLLLDIECGLSLADYRVIRTFTMGKGGEATFLASPSEIQRIALTKQKEEIFLDDHGCLFTLCEVPQPKPKGFFESFFSSTPSPLDREELFGEKSGNISRNVAQYVPGSGMTSLRNQTDSVAGAALRARTQLLERGEKLNALSERTEEMNLKANKLASASKALAEKYKKQKWYQF